MVCSSATTCPAVTLALPLQAQPWGMHCPGSLEHQLCAGLANESTGEGVEAGDKGRPESFSSSFSVSWGVPGRSWMTFCPPSLNRPLMMAERQSGGPGLGGLLVEPPQTCRPPLPWKPNPKGSSRQDGLRGPSSHMAAWRPCWV